MHQHPTTTDALATTERPVQLPRMHTLRARVVGGRLRLDEATDLAKGSEVTLAVVGEEGLEASIDEALDDLASRDEGIAARDVLAELARR